MYFHPLLRVLSLFCGPDERKFHRMPRKTLSKVVETLSAMNSWLACFFLQVCHNQVDSFDVQGKKDDYMHWIILWSGIWGVAQHFSETVLVLFFSILQAHYKALKKLDSKIGQTGWRSAGCNLPCQRWRGRCNLVYNWASMIWQCSSFAPMDNNFQQLSV